MKRFEVYLVSLDPARGSEIKRTRPCLIVSPDEATARMVAGRLVEMFAYG